MKIKSFNHFSRSPTNAKHWPKHRRPRGLRGKVVTASATGSVAAMTKKRPLISNVSLNVNDPTNAKHWPSTANPCMEANYLVLSNVDGML